MCFGSTSDFLLVILCGYLIDSISVLVFLSAVSQFRPLAVLYGLVPGELEVEIW